MSLRLSAEILFWLLLACIVHVYLFYPLAWAVMARLHPRPWKRCPAFRPRVSIIMAARNEQANIARRVRELLHLLDLAELQGELIVVSDGSTDLTADIVQRIDDDRICLINLKTNCGKAAALSEACKRGKGDIHIFADVRQTWASDTLPLLLENFADTNVGAVSGDLILRDSSGVMRGLGFYWKFEKWLRRSESAIGSMIGVSGSICAVRRELFDGIPNGTLLDDVYWPLRVAIRGYRVVHDERARAFDRLPDRPKDEFRRKVRTLAGNFQLATLLPEALLPGRNPVWFSYISHKLLRLVVPWSMLLMFLLSLVLTAPVYRAALAVQVAFYAISITGILFGQRVRFRLFSLASSLLILNAAAFVAFWVWISRNSARSWSPIRYQVPSPAPKGASATANT